ncbi:MAG: DUF4160 domain-containing protein [Deltaproteobacteria bacterium]|nr:DUF4160 domain-containing protein [Deltaproteobacteria bacterium]
MPTVLRVAGYRFFFFSNEGDEPTHIHVETAGKHAKYWLGPVVLASSHGYSSKELSRITRLVVDNEGLFVERWHEHFRGQ